MILLHEEKPIYDLWFKLVFVIPVVLGAGATVTGLVTQDMEPFLVMLGDAALISLIFYFAMPRNYQIHQDSLRIVLGGPFVIRIPLSTIREARRASGSGAWIYSGVRFATSSRYVVEIVRSRGLNYVISPQNGDLFIDQLNQAVKSSRSYAVK